MFSLLAFTSLMILSSFAQTVPLSAGEVLAKAFSKAKAENKNVIIIFHASWCGWCKKLDAAMNDTACKTFFDDNYVIEHLTILESEGKNGLENPGAEELFKKRAPNGSGIPFWLVYDANGRVIGDAILPDGNNSGCPAAVQEVEPFINVLRKSSKMDEETRKVIFDRFRKNEPLR